MSELAFNITGDAFDVPELVTGWRVKRLKPRGAPELVYGSDGFPLTVPIDCDMDGLRQAVGGVLSKYRLDAVDDSAKLIDGVEPAYVTVAKVDQPRVVEKAARDDSDSLLRDAMRHNTELAKSVIDKFPEMMMAAADLLRAADGAGLPSRQPRVVEVAGDEDEDDDDTREPSASSPAFELINTLVAQLIPMLVTSFASKQMPKLGAVLDWRKAVPEMADVEPRATSTAKSEPAALPPLDPNAMSHFIAIQSALAPDEAARARQLAAELSPLELRAWFAELSTLPVQDAITKIRSFIGATANKGAAS